MERERGEREQLLASVLNFDQSQERAPDPDAPPPIAALGARGERQRPPR